jgi:pimeloyl-ACP methyl ester carboxylesterase
MIRSMSEFLIGSITFVILVAMVFSAWKTRRIEADYPNQGERIDIGGYSLNSVLVPRPQTADLPPLVFVHGASGNLLDQMHAFRGKLEGRADMLFVDRPGHGYSDRGGPANDTPDGQADAIAALMDKRGIQRAIIIGHSFGGSIVASFALRHPEKVAGLLFLAPATHPWPGGVEWYYSAASTPVLGWLFTHVIAMPAGLMRLSGGIDSVFSPNKAPEDYLEKTAPALVLRPDTFANNARDVANLHAYVARVAPQYSSITAPTVIITGDSDDIVLENIHSRGLARDIKGSELLWIKNLGHKPDYIATDLAIAALEKLSGKTIDLQALARQTEARIASDHDTIDQ